MTLEKIKTNEYYIALDQAERIGNYAIDVTFLFLLDKENPTRMGNLEQAVHWKQAEHYYDELKEFYARLDDMIHNFALENLQGADLDTYKEVAEIE